MAMANIQLATAEFLFERKKVEDEKDFLSHLGIISRIGK